MLRSLFHFSLIFGFTSACALAGDSISPVQIKLFESARSGDLREAQAAVAEGADPNFHSEMKYLGYTPLIQAIAHRQFPVAEYLLPMQLDLNVADNLGMTALFHAVFAKNEKLVNDLLQSPQLDLYKLNLRGEDIVEFAQSQGTSEIARILESRLSSIRTRIPGAHYLIINFLGFGGGGRIGGYDEKQLEKHPAVDHLFYLRRKRQDYHEIQHRIRRWMRFDVSQGGPRHQSVIIVGSSWGSQPANRLAKWFHASYGKAPRYLALIDGANLVGLPRLSIGPALQSENHYAEGWHWPKATHISGAGTNHNLGNMDHNSALSIGADRATASILKVLEAPCEDYLSE